ncbi:winged helix-turn-helix domain-containing protein [Nocardia noduli]|uniref:winged helix-turn-helix domain-containing protein n=1 Tax=Nocardia noduli TaxID=2815722 RepID=UPI001C21DB35|nr:winged helix-turn-helix domain-containing protein [Nocardia noduli]
MAQYYDLADRLRERIQSGEFALGDKLPSISEIQREYSVHSLNTVRAAQQKLAEEGLIETRQGAGAFVVGTESLKTVDILGELTTLRDRMTTVLAAMDSQRRHSITINLDDPAEDHLYFVLTDALSEWASQQRHEAEHDQPESRIAWAETAERLLARIEYAL